MLPIHLCPVIVLYYPQSPRIFLNVVNSMSSQTISPLKRLYFSVPLESPSLMTDVSVPPTAIAMLI